MAGRRGRRAFGRVRKLSSGRWQAFYRDPDGRTRLSKSGKPTPVRWNAPTTFDTREDAEAWLTDERRLISWGSWTPPPLRVAEARRIEEQRRANIFATYARSWLRGRHDLRPTTRASYATAIDQHLIPAFGAIPLSDITADEVRRWFASYGSRTPTARAHAYAVLTGIMGQALEDDLITRNPCRIKKGGRAAVKREPEVLALPELLALADAMPEQHRALTLLSGLCGLRFGEAVALRRRDVDLDRAELTVSRTAVRAEGIKTEGPPKTAAGRRRVAMPALVVEALREHLRSQPVTGRDALIFPGRNGAILAPSALYGRASRVETRGGRTYEKQAYGFARAREAIGKPDLTWHDLRRTAATLGAQAGATVREMQSRLGHATPAMALHYQSATAERDRAIADRLQAQLDALREPSVMPLRRAENGGTQ